MNIKKEKNNKKKTFYFDDYTESEIINKSTEVKLVKISSSRVNFLFFTFFSLILIFSIKIIYLSLYPEKNYFLQKTNYSFTKERGDIVDRNDEILSRNIKTFHAAIRPSLIKDKDKFLVNIKLNFPNISQEFLKKKLSDNKYFY